VELICYLGELSPSSCYPTLLHTFNPNKTRTYFPRRYLSSDSHLISAYGSVGMKYDRKLKSIQEKTGSYYFFIPQVIALTWKSFFLQLEEKYILSGFMIVFICSIFFPPTYHVLPPLLKRRSFWRWSKFRKASCSQYHAKLRTFFPLGPLVPEAKKKEAMRNRTHNPQNWACRLEKATSQTSEH
jgi:hypothetical protein